MSKKHKKQWKNDAEQLKKDLDSRPKEVRRNEVALKFGGVAKKTSGKTVPHKTKRSGGDSQSDSILRRQLGL